MEIENYDYLFKIVLIGDVLVGKTNIISKYLRNVFSDNSKGTVGVELGTTYNNKYKCKLQIWDTAGPERYRSIIQAYYKGAH